jgi:hypothetical protein
MLREERRLHAELFGNRRFLLFPAFVTALVAGGVWLLELTGTPRETIVGGLFVLVLFFGFQVGTIGLVGRDAMRDVLGDVTLLVFSARTLPVSQRRLLATFLVKDLVYYAGFFLTPIALGFLPVVLAGDLSLAAGGLLWLTLVGTFALGTAMSLTLAGVATRSSVAAVAVLAALVAGVVLEPALATDLTPYALYADPGLDTLVTAGLALFGVLVVAPLVFEPPSRSGVRRVDRNRYRQIAESTDAYTARPLLSVARSSGSVWKVAFSLGILFAVTALLLDRLVAATGLEPSAGIAFGALLGLGSFTTYNWVTQGDDPREYLRYPDEMGAVFAGKGKAFGLLALPTGLAYLALAGLWYPVTDLLLGVVVFPLVSVYVFGVTAYVTGLSPNELLFDTVLFALYGVALATLAVPLLVAALAYGAAPTQTTAVAVGLSVVAALVGVALARRAGPRWHERLRTHG